MNILERLSTDVAWWMDSSTCFSTERVTVVRSVGTVPRRMFLVLTDFAADCLKLCPSCSPPCLKKK